MFTTVYLLYFSVSFFFFVLLFYSLLRQQYIPYNARGGGDARRGRGGFQGSPGGLTHTQAAENKDGGQMPQRVPPATYVCYRCGQKGIHTPIFFIL